MALVWQLQISDRCPNDERQLALLLHLDEGTRSWQAGGELNLPRSRACFQRGRTAPPSFHAAACAGDVLSAEPPADIVGPGATKAAPNAKSKRPFRDGLLLTPAFQARVVRRGTTTVAQGEVARPEWAQEPRHVERRLPACPLERNLMIIVCARKPGSVESAAVAGGRSGWRELREWGADVRTQQRTVDRQGSAVSSFKCPQSAPIVSLGLT